MVVEPVSDIHVPFPPPNFGPSYDVTPERQYQTVRPLKSAQS